MQTIAVLRLLSLTSAVSLLLIGCGKDSSPKMTGTDTETQSSVSADPSESELASVLAELTQALRKFSAENRRVPASLDELVASGYIRNLPQLPSGKAFAIDAKNLKVFVK